MPLDILHLPFLVPIPAATLRRSGAPGPAFSALCLLAVALLMSSGSALAEENFWLWLVNFSRQKEVKPVDNKTYKDECGSCHFAYQPGLLPGKSWAKLLDEKALADHFGEDASLDKDTLKTIRDYAMANAAEKSYYKRSRKIALATEDRDGTSESRELVSAFVNSGYFNFVAAVHTPAEVTRHAVRVGWLRERADALSDPGESQCHVSVVVPSSAVALVCRPSHAATSLALDGRSIFHAT